MFSYIIAGLASVAAALVLYFKTNPGLAQKQKISLAVLRALALGLVFLFLLTPIIYYIRHFTERPEIILLKDNSASMQIQHQSQSKADRLESLYSKLKAAYKDAGYLVREQVFADGLNGDKNSTFLLPALEELRQQDGKTDLRQIILFSDGWLRDTDLPALKNYDMPVHAVFDSSRQQAADLLVSDFRHNKQGYRNELSLFEASVQATDYTGSAILKFIIDNQVAAQKNVSFQMEPVQTVSFNHRFAKTGLHKVEVQVSAAGVIEQTQSNNNHLSAIDILTDKERMLLFTDAPNWDTKFILDVIRENNRIEPASYTVKGNQLYQGEQNTTLRDFNNVTAIIIVNQGSLQLDNTLAQSIMAQVRQGCGLLYMGLPVPQLNEILPLRQANIRSSYKGLIKLQPAAGVYSAFNIPSDELAQIPPVDYYYLSAIPTAEVLAVLDNAQKSPAAAVSAALNGKVISLAFLNLWRWQLQSKNQGYKTFTADLLTWLSNRTAGQFRALYEPAYYPEEPLSIRLTAIDETRRARSDLAPKITVVNSKNETVFSDFLTQAEEDYTVSFRLTNPDQYSFRIVDQNSGKSAAGKFLLLPRNQEARDLGYNHTLLSWITQQTSGRIMNLEETANYQPVKAVKADRMEKKDFPLYKKWYLITLFIIVFCLELFFRRRWGLL
ncbi:MAG: hypothetical protein R6V77_00575 [Candidatus Cloacimonadaceae bacterium]